MTTNDAFKVKNLYVVGWSEARTEEQIQELFTPFGNVEKVKKIGNYSFVHFAEREQALSGNRFEFRTPSMYLHDIAFMILLKYHAHKFIYITDPSSDLINFICLSSSSIFTDVLCSLLLSLRKIMLLYIVS